MLCIILAGCLDSSNSSDKKWGNAPDFTLTTIDGESFTLSDNYGKVIILDLMAAWCSPCQLQMVELKKTIDEKGDDIVLVSVDVDKGETSSIVRSTFSEYIDDWIFVMDNNDENVGQKYQADRIPTLVIIDKEGNIYYSQIGLTTKEVLLELIDGASGEV